MNMKLRLAVLLMCWLGFMLGGTAAVAQTPARADHAALAPSDLKWMPAPPVIPPGVQLAVLRGNPFAEGICAIRLKIPPHYTFPPH